MNHAGAGGGGQGGTSSDDEQDDGVRIQLPSGSSLSAANRVSVATSCSLPQRIILYPISHDCRCHALPHLTSCGPPRAQRANNVPAASQRQSTRRKPHVDLTRLDVRVTRPRPARGQMHAL